MAGVNPSAGTPVGTSTVPSIGGDAKVVASAHLDDKRAEGVAYDSNQSIGVKLDTSGYPDGTPNAGPNL